MPKLFLLGVVFFLCCHFSNAEENPDSIYAAQRESGAYGEKLYRVQVIADSVGQEEVQSKVLARQAEQEGFSLSTQEESEVRRSQSEGGSQCIGRQSMAENKVENLRNPSERFQDRETQGDLILEALYGMMGAFDHAINSND